MAQHDYVLESQAGANFRADLNNALLAIASNNSGESEPSVTYAHQWWADTAAGYLKRRNAANDAWISVMSLTLAMTTLGETLASAANNAEALAALGATATGSAVFTATDEAAARAAIGLTYGPVFAASQSSGQIVSSGVSTKCAMSVEEFDSAGAYSTSTYRFQPAVAGYYRISLSISGQGATTTGNMMALIFKNGSAIANSRTPSYGNNSTGWVTVTALVHMNGTTDYVEPYVNIEGTGTLTVNVNTNMFCGELVRRA